MAVSLADKICDNDIPVSGMIVKLSEYTEQIVNPNKKDVLTIPFFVRSELVVTKVLDIVISAI